MTDTFKPLWLEFFISLVVLDPIAVTSDILVCVKWHCEKLARNLNVWQNLYNEVLDLYWQFLVPLCLQEDVVPCFMCKRDVILLKCEKELHTCMGKINLGWPPHHIFSGVV